MSYDIEIVIHHPDGYSTTVDVGNMTYNVARMMIPACGVSFSWMDGMTVKRALPIIRHAWREMKRDPDRYIALEVTDWGAYSDFMPWFTRFYVLCRLHPTGVIGVY